MQPGFVAALNIKQRNVMYRLLYDLFLGDRVDAGGSDPVTSLN
jgi:hypothetical protein